MPSSLNLVRGFVSLGKLEKDTTVVDYHGKIITGPEVPGVRATTRRLRASLSWT